MAAPAADGSDHLDVVFGHRRRQAALNIGLATAPVLVRPDLVDLPAKEAQLVENLQRVGISPIEEARGYRDLMALYGLKQTEIARRVGRGQPHISKRLALLDLPPQAQAAVDDGRVPVNVAVELARLPREQIDAVLFAVERGTEVTAAVRRASAEAERAEDRCNAIMTLQVDAVRVIESRYRPIWNLDDGPYPLAHMPWVDADEHADGPCHAAVVTSVPFDSDAGDAVRRWTMLVCTTPTNHPTDEHADDPEELARLAAAELERSQQRQQSEELASATRRRREFIAGLVAPRRKLSKALGQEHLERASLLCTLTEAPYQPGRRSFTLAASWVAPMLDNPADVVLNEASALSGDQLLRWALANRLAVDDLALNGDAGYRDATLPRRVAQEHLDYLERAGYVVSDLERDLLRHLPNGDNGVQQRALTPA